MDKLEFTKLYSQWFALHPFKKRDWRELGAVHYQAFGKESVALMTEALGQLTEELDHFPLPKDIRSKLNKLSSSKTESSGSRTNTTFESEQIATRLLEHRHGVQYDGVTVKRPENVPTWIEQLVDRVDNELGVQYPLKTKLGTLGLMVVQTQGRR